MLRSTYAAPTTQYSSQDRLKDVVMSTNMHCTSPKGREYMFVYAAQYRTPVMLVIDNRPAIIVRTDQNVKHLQAMRRGTDDHAPLRIALTTAGVEPAIS
jgi:hypothetical protein